jgi:nitronate monooxygenase
VAVFASGLGSPGFLVERAHAQGMLVMSVVGNVRAARKVAGDGVDVVIAQGHDGGGHVGKIGSFVLIPQVVDAVQPLPVVAAGGVADGRGVAAALAFGCEGVWVGTRFLATREANIPDWKKEQIVEATDTATRVTRCYTGKPCRVIRNHWTDAWETSTVEPLPMPAQPTLVRPMLEAAANPGEVQANLAGQASGLVSEVKPAADVVTELVEDATKILGRLG